MRCHSLLLALAAAFIPSSAAALETSLNLPRNVDPILSELGPQLSPGASIILPGDLSLFANLTARYTSYLAPGITAVVKVGTEADVAATISYGKRVNRDVLAQNAGHGWASSLADIENGILIRIDGLDAVSINSARNTMTVGGGVSVGDVIPPLYAAGKETSTGTCNCVGFLGAGLGGGHGRLQGLHGLIADNLISARLVIATGKILTVSKKSNIDLYWALRGAGHNFGIVTEATFRIYDQTNSGLHSDITLSYDAADLEAIFTAINNFVQPAEASIYVVLAPDKTLKPILTLDFVYAGPSATAQALFTATFGHLTPLTRVDAIWSWDKLNDQGSTGLFGLACHSIMRRNSYGAYLKTYDVGDMRAVYNSYAAFISANPTATGSIIIFESYPNQAVKAVDEMLTAFAHRDQRHLILVGAGYMDASLDDAATVWGGSVVDTLNAQSGNDRLRVYVNYAHGNEKFGAKYGYERWRQAALRSLKRRWDPEGAFNGFHPIP